MFLRNEPITGPRARFHSQAALLSQLWWGHHGAGAEREGLSASLCPPWAADPSLPRPTASHDALSVPQTSQAGSHSRTSDFLCPFRVGHSLTTEKPWPAYLHPLTHSRHWLTFPSFISSSLPTNTSFTVRLIPLAVSCSRTRERLSCSGCTQRLRRAWCRRRSVNTSPE